MDIKVNKNTVIVFDLDDTLYNEIEYLKSAYRSIAKYLVPQNWQQLYSTMFSLYRNNENVFTYLSETYKVEVKELIGMYRSHIPEIQLFDGVLDTINAIKKKDGKIGVITDGRTITQTTKLKVLGIEHLIDKIIISESIGTEKPNEANFKAIENSLSGNEYYYIADNLKKDFVAPNALGWKSIALIDSGLNIHSNAYLYPEKKHLPSNYILAIEELNII